MALWCDLTHNADQHEMLKKLADKTATTTGAGHEVVGHLPLQFLVLQKPRSSSSSYCPTISRS